MSEVIVDDVDDVDGVDDVDDVDDVECDMLCDMFMVM